MRHAQVVVVDIMSKCVDLENKAPPGSDESRLSSDEQHVPEIVINPFTAMMPLQKRPTKVQSLKSLSLFFFFFFKLFFTGI